MTTGHLLTNSAEAWGHCGPLVEPGQSSDWGSGGKAPGRPRADASYNTPKQAKKTHFPFKSQKKKTFLTNFGLICHWII